MSGIVRGWTDAQELGETAAALERETIASVTLSRIEISGDIPVAVVPLDDATLAGMAEKIARVYFDADALPSDSWEKAGDANRSAFRAIAHEGLRAALGLEGGA